MIMATTGFWGISIILRRWISYALYKLLKMSNLSLFVSSYVHFTHKTTFFEYTFYTPYDHTQISYIFWQSIYNYLYANNRYSIVTTHSPIFLRKIKDENVRPLKDGHLDSKEKLQQIKELSCGLINYFEGTLLLNSNNPLILVEGIGDVNYIKRAIELLVESHSNYSNISWDFLFMGGAGENAKQYIDKLHPYINPDRQVVVVFDRDESGALAMKRLGGKGGREDFRTRKKGNWYFLMLPKTPEHTEIDFTIEDYFSVNLKKSIAKQKIEESNGFFNKLPKDLRQNVKDTLGNKLNDYTPEEMAGFSLLIDKILCIIEGKELDIEEL